MSGDKPEKTKQELLAEPFPDSMLRVNAQKHNITYVPGSEVVARLNRVLGIDGWSWEVTARWADGTVETPVGDYPKWVMVEGDLTLTTDAERTVRRSGIGGQEVKFRSGGGGPVDLGDEWKGAATDALKKAAMHLGVGLDLARSEEAKAWEERYGKAPATESGRAAIERAFAEMGDVSDRKAAKQEYFAKYGRPDELTADREAEAVAWTELRTGVRIGEGPLPTEAPESPAEVPTTDSTPGGAPLAPPSALEALRDRVQGLPEAEQDVFKSWWKANVGKRMDDGTVTIDEYEAAEKYLGG